MAVNITGLAEVMVSKPPLCTVAPLLVTTGAVSMPCTVTVEARFKALVSAPPLVVPPESFKDVKVTTRLPFVGALLVF